MSTEGDFAADESDAPFVSPAFGCWYYLEGVDVLASPSVKGAVLALGDSLTDGLGSSWTRTPATRISWRAGSWRALRDR